MTPGYVTKELRTLLETFDIDLLFRIVRHERRGTPLAAVPVPSRFSDPNLQYSVRSRQSMTYTKPYASPGSL